MKRWKKIVHANSNKKIAGIIILLLDTIDFKSKKRRAKKGHYILIRDSIKQEIITIININSLHD